MQSTNRVSCAECAYARDACGYCDIFGTKVSPLFLCRSFRRPRQAHEEARSRWPILEQLKPGVVYALDHGSSDSNGHPRPAFRVQAMQLELMRRYTAPVRMSNGSLQEGVFECFSYAPTSGDDFEVRCWLLLAIGKRRLEATSYDFFSALSEIREQLEKERCMPAINGTNRNAVITGMATNMGMGLKVYLVKMGQRANPETDLVETFGTDSAMDPVTLAEQQEFGEAWWRSVEGH